MLIDKHTCESIQCGATTQLEAGIDEIMDCAGRGYVGVRSCLDPICVADLKPSYCESRVIPFSPADVPDAPDEVEVLRRANVRRNPLLQHETKRRRDDYQEMVMCPGGEESEFTMGVDTWRGGGGAIIDKLMVMNDLGIGELIGFLTPAVLIGIGGYLYLRK